MTKKERSENLEDMRKLLIEFRNADRKYLDKKLREQTNEVNDVLDKQDLERARILNKMRETIKDDTEKSYFKYKSELVSQIDPILKEVVASREERLTTSEQISRNKRGIDRNSKRISKLQIGV